jgi:hypothetical protein
MVCTGQNTHFGMRSPNLYTFSFIENFFCSNFFFLERMEEHRDLAKKRKKKQREQRERE